VALVILHYLEVMASQVLAVEVVEPPVQEQVLLVLVVLVLL
jgi:hypothetical protein